MKRFNLMPKEVSYAEGPSDYAPKKSRDFQIVLVTLPLILAVAIVYFLHISSATVNVDINPAQLLKLESLNKEYKALLTSLDNKSDIGRLIEERNKLRNNLNTIKSLNLVRSVPLDLLVAIGKNISEKVALTMISKTTIDVVLEGVAMDNKSLSEFMEVLVNQNVFKRVTIKSTEYSDEFGPYKQKFVISGVM